MNITISRKRMAVIVALTLPVLGIAGLIVRGELAWRGSEWRFPIEGNDPRDLLRGHYLTYRILWGAIDEGSLDGKNCLCLEHADGEQRVRRLACHEALACAARLTSGDVEQLQRYYIPEAWAGALDRAVREGRGEIVVSVVRGEASLRDLLVDGRPWREAIESSRQRDQDPVAP